MWPLRSMLYVPAHRRDWVGKAIRVMPDAVILDVEDSVPPANKQQARDNLHSEIEELAAAGINATVGIRDHDDVIVWNGLTAARAQRADHVAFLEVSLPYQLFATRLSVLLLALKPHLSGMTADQVTSTVRTHVCNWLQLQGLPTPEQLSVQARPAEGAPGLELAVTVTPPQRVLPGGIPMVLGYRLS